MAKATQTTTVTRTRKKKSTSNDDTMPCNVCHGTGRQKKPSRKK
mgnify:CR=1 FL=1